MEELWQGQAGTGESQTMYGAFPAFPHFPNLSCSTTPAHFIFLNEPRVSVQQHKSQNTIMSFPSCGNVPCPGVGRSLTFQWTLCRISSVIIFPWWSEAERWIQQKKQNQNFLLQVKANALLTISQVRGFFPLKMSIGTFLITGLEICHENTLKYALALTLLPEAISQSSPDILEPLESFLWDWKASSQEKAEPPCDWDGQFPRKTVH